MQRREGEGPRAEDRVPEEGLTRLGQHLARRAPAPLRGWLDEAGLLAGAQAFLAPLLERLADEALAASFYDYARVPGTAAADYRSRVVAVPGAGLALCGIRFKGGDLARPFVEVAPDFALDAGTLPGLRSAVATSFATFRPEAVRRWRFEGEPALPGEVPDQAYHVAPLAAIRAHPAPRAPRLIDLVPARDLEWYDAVGADHAACMAADPALAAEVSYEAREDLAACLAAGLLFEARVDGALAGVIAFDADAFFGLPGYSVREEILLAPYRGRGQGPWLQRLAAERLPGDGLMFGTIHALNVASRRTATAVGRRPVMACGFLPCGGPAGYSVTA